MKRAVFILLSFALLFFSSIPTMYELSQKENLKNRSFELVHNYYTDYHFYLSRIREGWEGRWTVTERYTSEPHAGSLIQFGYLLLGQASRFIPDSSFAVPAAYHVARFVFGFLLLAMIWHIAGTVTRTFFWRVVGFLLAASASTWPILVTLPDGSFRLGGYMPWWTVMDSLQRLTFVPHLLVGQTLILFLIASLSNEAVVFKKWNWIPLGVVLFLLGVIFPPGLPVVGIAAGFMIIREAVEHHLWHKKMGDILIWAKAHIGIRALIGLMGLPTILYFSRLLTQVPWRRLVEFDALNPTSFSVLEYAKALGPVLPLGIVFFVIALFFGGKRVRFLIVFVASWLAALIFLVIFQTQSPLRMTQVGSHIPLGLLIAWGCERTMGFILRKKKIQKNIRTLAGIIVILIPFAILVSAFATMHSSWLWQKDFIDQKVAAGWPVIPMRNYIVYPVTPFIEAIETLSSFPPSTIVLSELTAGNYIPVISGKRVYVGHDNTVDKEKKLIFVREFFAGTMDEAVASAWIGSAGITHVFVGPEEDEGGNGSVTPSKYHFLREVYKNPTARVYEIDTEFKIQ